MLDRLETEHVELEKLENIRKDFVINVSHELRTPLASIQGYTETLLDGAIHDPVNNIKFLNIIRQNTERLARLTADLLTLSRVELNQQELKFASYYVNRLLTDNLDGMRPIASSDAGSNWFCSLRSPPVPQKRPRSSAMPKPSTRS